MGNAEKHPRLQPSAFYILPYGHITLAQVHAALAFYLANRGAVDAEIASQTAEADRLEREHRRPATAA